MACLNTLKLEIKTLEKIFTKNHERFQILNSSVDELTCRFIGKNGKRYDIHANITNKLLNFTTHSTETLHLNREANRKAGSQAVISKK
uniref:Uncharacterized protein n=1 Tax=Glossina palpalis gambiensis TaxID=67801 RepID=A0A1B0BAX4_9MUSC